MFCTKCGAELEDGLEYCSACGARITPEQRAGNRVPRDEGAPIEDAADVTTVIGGSSSQESPAPEVTAPIPAAMHTSAPDAARSPVPGPAPRRDGRLKVACAIAAVIAGFALLGFLFWAFALGGLFSEPEPVEPVPIEGSAAVEEDDAQEPVALALSIDALDSSEYPHMTVDFTLSTADTHDLSLTEEGQEVLSQLDDASFVVTDSLDGGEALSVQIEDFRLLDAGSSWRIECTATDSVGAGTHILEVSLDPDTGYTASTSVQFMVTDADELAERPDEGAGTYLVPASSTREVDASDLEGLSDWELCLARNEIYARHGRMFNNAEIQAYFDGQDWYEPVFAPADFDERAQLSDLELANIDTIYAYEQERGSQYVS